MDLRKVKKLIELVEESAIKELEVASGDESIRIVMHRGASLPTIVTTDPAPAAVQPGSPSSRALTVTAPMAGTFFRASQPDAAPFVEVGQTVQVGDVLCIIESMKMMHEIHAADAGTVMQVCIGNAQPVNSGEVLFKLS